MALHATNEQQLEDIAVQLDRAGIYACRITESDPPYTGQLMAIGIVPCQRDTVRKILSNLPLVKALLAQSVRAPRVMTLEVAGSTPAGRATSAL